MLGRFKDNRGISYSVGGAQLQMSKEYEVFEYDGRPKPLNKDGAYLMDMCLSKIYVRDPAYKSRGRASIVKEHIDILDPEWVDYLEFRLESKPGSTNTVVELDEEEPPF
jgi:hypothetical protein